MCNFSLFCRLDDVLDRTEYRKKNPTAHKKFGEPLSVIAGILGDGFAMKNAMELCPNGGAEEFMLRTLNYYRGNGIEIYWRDGKICPTETEYLASILLKWFTILNFMIRLLQIRANDKQDLTEIIRLFACFQAIVNDYSDFFSPYYEGKKVCDDMTEGKFTFPMIHAIKEKGNQEVYSEYSLYFLLEIFGTKQNLWF